MIDTGGYVTFSCNQQEPNPCNTSDVIELIDPNGKEAMSRNCNGNRDFTWRLDINENTMLGKYNCRYKNYVETVGLEILYRICKCCMYRHATFSQSPSCASGDYVRMFLRSKTNQKKMTILAL